MKKYLRRGKIVAYLIVAISAFVHPLQVQAGPDNTSLGWDALMRAVVGGDAAQMDKRAAQSREDNKVEENKLDASRREDAIQTTKRSDARWAQHLQDIKRSDARWDQKRWDEQHGR